MNNIAAFTALGCSYPAFISINEKEEDIEIQVRSAAVGDACGSQASIRMSRQDFTEFLQSAGAKFWSSEGYR